MGTSKRTGRHGRGINTGKNTGEKNGMGKSGSITRTMAEAEENTAIKHKLERG
jgi:hypothetical protein